MYLNAVVLVFIVVVAVVVFVVVFIIIVVVFCLLLLLRIDTLLSLFPQVMMYEAIRTQHGERMTASELNTTSHRMWYFCQKLHNFIKYNFYT